MTDDVDKGTAAAQDPFADHADAYAETIETATAFSHQGHNFFTRAKVRHLLDFISTHVGDPASQRVLDVGCGPGVTDAQLVGEVGRLSGSDPSAALLDRAVADNPSVDYRLGDGDTLPFDDAAFGVTFTICVLHHVPPPQWADFMAEMARVTRPGGLAIVMEHNPWNPLTRRAVNTCPFDEGVTLLSRPTTTSLAKAAGMEVVDGSYILFAPFGDRASDLADRALGWLPMGGQYWVAATPPATTPATP